MTCYGNHRRVQADPAELPSQKAVQSSSQLPPPSYDSRLWAVTCRPQEKMSTFTPSTMLFQPDCRKFCKHGLECKKLKSADAKDEAHCALFIHVAKEERQSAISFDQECQERAKNATAKLIKDPSLPHSPCTLPDPGNMYMEETLSLSPQFHNRAVVVFVHGLKSGPDNNVVAKSMLFLEGLTESRREDQGDPLVLSFLWPAHRRVVSYVPARSNTKQASARLAHLLHTLRSLKCHVIVIAHSLGARVALGALSMPRHVGTAPIASATLCDHLLLCAAALPCDALAESGEFPRSQITAAKVTAFYSGRDAVLRASFGLAEAFRVGYKKSLHKGKVALNNTMGCRGLQLPLPVGCASINVSEDIHKHSAVQWLLCPDVLQSVRQCIDECPTKLDTNLQEVVKENSHAAPLDSWSWAQILQGGSDAIVAYSDDDSEDSPCGSSPCQEPKPFQLPENVACRGYQTMSPAAERCILAI